MSSSSLVIELRRVFSPTNSPSTSIVAINTNSDETMKPASSEINLRITERLHFPKFDISRLNRRCNPVVAISRQFEDQATNSLNCTGEVEGDAPEGKCYAALKCAHYITRDLSAVITRQLLKGLIPLSRTCDLVGRHIFCENRKASQHQWSVVRFVSGFAKPSCAKTHPHKRRVLTSVNIFTSELSCLRPPYLKGYVCRAKQLESAPI